MARIFLTLVAFGIIASGIFLTKGVPYFFHQYVHQNLAPDILSVKPQHKVISTKEQSSMVSSEDWNRSIHSISDLNPLNNHLIFKWEKMSTGEKIEAKVFGTFSGILSVHIEISDLNLDLNKLKLSAISPHFTFSVPYHSDLLRDETRWKYVFSNLTSEANLRKFNIDVSDSKEAGLMRFDNFTGKILFQNLGDQDRLKISSHYMIKKSFQQTKDIKVSAQDISGDFSIDSINLKGISEASKKYREQTKANKHMPAMFIAMGLMDDIKKSFYFPIVISLNYQALTDQGDTEIKSSFKLEDLEKNDPMSAYHARAEIKIPRSLLETKAIDYIAQQVAGEFKGKLYLIGQTNPETATNLMDKVKLQVEIERKLTEALFEYFNQEVEGKKKSSILLEELIRQNMIGVDKDNIILSLDHKNMKLTINGQSPTEKILATAPISEIMNFLQIKGFVAIKGP